MEARGYRGGRHLIVRVIRPLTISCHATYHLEERAQAPWFDARFATELLYAMGVILFATMPPKAFLHADVPFSPLSFPPRVQSTGTDAFDSPPSHHPGPSPGTGFVLCGLFTGRHPGATPAAAAGAAAAASGPAPTRGAFWWYVEKGAGGKEDGMVRKASIALTSDLLTYVGIDPFDAAVE